MEALLLNILSPEHAESEHMGVTISAWGQAAHNNKEQTLSSLQGQGKLLKGHKTRLQVAQQMLVSDAANIHEPCTLATSDPYSDYTSHQDFLSLAWLWPS